MFYKKIEASNHRGHINFIFLLAINIVDGQKRKGQVCVLTHLPVKDGFL